MCVCFSFHRDEWFNCLHIWQVNLSNHTFKFFIVQQILSVQDILADRRNMGNILDLTCSKSWLVPCQDPPDTGSDLFKLAENICQ